MVDSLSKIAKSYQNLAGIEQKSKLKPKGYVSNAFKKIKELNSTHPSFTKRYANIKKVARASGL